MPRRRVADGLQSEADARAACLWPGTPPCTRASGPRGPQNSQAHTPGGGQGTAPQLTAKGEALGAPACTRHRKGDRLA